MIGWYIAPYKIRGQLSGDVRYCAVGDFAKDLRADDGATQEIEIDGNKAIVKVRASQILLDRIVKDSDVQILKIDDPTEYWTPTRTSPTSGRIFQNKTIAEVELCLLDDQRWGEMKAVAEALIAQSYIEGYVRIQK